MTRLLACLLFAAWLAFTLVGPAPAAPVVYTGCAAPPATPSGNVHYVDPINGSMSGDGTLAHPWSTLTEVVAAGLFYNTPVHGLPHINPNAPIQAGDTVYLLSGNHGPVVFQGWYGKALVGYNNSSFITVAALPGQTPVLSQLRVQGGSKWLFRGLTVQSVNITGSYVVAGTSSQDFWLVSFQGPHSDVVFDGNSVSSTSDVSQWGILDWLTKRSSGVEDVGGTCVAITNNYLSNVGFGVATQASRSVFISGNTINYFSDDGIDFGSLNTTITYNTITNSVEDGDGFHRDAMQGLPYGGTTPNTNVDIESNVVIRLMDPLLPYPGYLQGIDEFDGVWNHLYVKHNVIVTDASQGIAYYGVNGGAIDGNTVIGDSGKVLPCAHLTFAQCQTQSVINDTSAIPSINVTNSKTGVPATNIVVINNIMTALGVDSASVTPVIGENICLLTGAKCLMGFPINGVMAWNSSPGVYGTKNLISKLTPAQAFTLYDPIGMQYNLTLQAH